MCMLCCCIEEYGVTCGLDKFSSVFHQADVEFCLTGWCSGTLSCSHTFLQVHNLLLKTRWNVLEY